ncbi:phosphodiester glycosidase family protein [Butyrivibrio sp. VCB2006]|uniref:phosphodiester glycosidase family protein n=1 Tax=Butyrivibrio sp. VCB2006 TaxID=1280679 RepID=UPI000412A13B|nr:phosphodiester glycosidase family protein [Butyrivibrio sp. VCB2006]
MNRIALIPAYMPDEKMIDVSKGLYQEGFEIIIVNDGSPETFNKVFSDASRYARILIHNENKGKGEALKTGLEYIYNTYDAPYTIVNADADGQHRLEDIIKVASVAEANRSCLILGSRKMEGKVPFKSRAGNAITRFVYRLTTGNIVYDTQTGLRAYSDKLVPELLQICGSRYEYEMNMLMELPKHGIEIKEEWINTVYIGKNESSHFDPIKDSIKIYKEILCFCASSLISFLVDYGLFCVISAISGSLIMANTLARIISGTLNCSLNRKVVFKSQKDVATSAIKYSVLAVAILIINTFILEILAGMGLTAYAAKIITELALFVLSYFIQHSYIFKKGRQDHMKKHLWAICSAFALIAFTTYISLDTFIISESYNSNATEINTSLFDGQTDSDTQLTESIDNTQSESHKSRSSRKHSRTSASEGTTVTSSETTESSSGINASEPYTGENTVSSDNYSITLTEYYQDDTKIYVADVILSSAQYLKTAFANDTYGKNVTATTSTIAENNNAVLAINGDYYGVQENGYVIRNGIVYRDSANGSDVLCIYADGTMDILNDSEYSAEELVSRGVWQAFSFGPALVEDSSVTVDENAEVAKAKASNPRTAIGVIDANHFVFVVSDGRTSESEGLSLYELATFMKGLGVETAYNLDGGGSSTMYFNGYVVNNPTTGGSIKERSVSDIVYI